MKPSTLFVSAPSLQADKTEQTLLAKGLRVIRADNICFAEMYAEAEHFDAAVYDRSLTEEEQISLARVMRIRWPWMWILRWAPAGGMQVEEALFDCTAVSGVELASCLERWLAR